MYARRSSGLTEQDLHEAKVYLRTFNDACICVDDIAQREAAKAHYKDYIKQLIDGLKFRHTVLDNQGSLVSVSNQRTASIFKLMTFTNDIA